MALNHLHLHVADVARSQAFYETYFGLREDVRHGDVLFVADENGFQLALAPGKAPRGRGRAAGGGGRRPGLRVVPCA